MDNTTTTNGCGNGKCGNGACAAGGSGCGRRHGYGHHFNKRAWTLVLVIGAVYLALLARNAAKEHAYIGSRDTIAIGAEGKVTALPDIASLSVGVTAEKKTVAEAQKETTEKMNAIVAKIKELGVAAEDIKTVDYSIYPQYDWVDERQVERGFRVTQAVEVKVRDLTKIADTLSAVGALGANQVGGVTFTIDDPEELRQQARLKGLEAAQRKAQALADAAGVKLGRVVGFSENEGYVPTPMYYAKDSAQGLGGASASPSIQSGSQDVVVDVSVTYEILP